MLYGCDLVSQDYADDLRMNVTGPGGGDELNRLLQSTGRNDQAAFAELYKRTSPKLFGVCLRMLRDRGAAEEVLQETYTTVWRRAATYDATRASAITWLVALSRNKAIDRLRQHREELLDDPQNLDGAVDQQPTPAADAESSQEYRRPPRGLGEIRPPAPSGGRDAV